MHSYRLDNYAVTTLNTYFELIVFQSDALSVTFAVSGSEKLVLVLVLEKVRICPSLVAKRNCNRWDLMQHLILHKNHHRMRKVPQMIDQFCVGVIAEFFLDIHFI